MSLVAQNFRFRGASPFRHGTEVAQCARETAQWVPITLDYAGVRQLRYPYILRLRTGQKVTLREHTDTVIFWLVFARRHYPVFPTHRVIVDVGANIGIFTLYAAREVPGTRIVAIEPFPDTFQRLEELIEVNGLRGRVTALNCAVAGKAGSQRMDSAAEIPSQYRRIQAKETATLNAEHRGPVGILPGDIGVPIRAETLGDVLDQAGVAEADLVKMNIHGSEYEVLLGTDPSVLRRCHQIAVQYHSMPPEMGLGKQRIFERLGELGFRLLLDDDTHRGSGRALLAVS